MKSRVRYSLLTIAIPKRDLHHRYHVLIILLAPFELQQIVVGATRFFRKLAANLRSRVVDRALARLRIQKPASCTKDRVRFAAEHPFLAKHFGVSLGCCFKADVEMPG